MQTPSLYALTASRLLLGWIFLWAFLDKLFGLGFATKPEAAWIAGGSPTAGFLEHAVKGPLAPLFTALAGSEFVAVLFMAGLCLIGLSLLLGVGVRVACASGSLLLFIIYLSILVPEHNPFADEHLVYITLLGVIAWTPESWDFLSLSRFWKQIPLVKRFPWLA